MSYVYIQTEKAGAKIYPQDDIRFDHDLFTVGFYQPDGNFQAESDHSTREKAAARVNYLNGGQR